MNGMITFNNVDACAVAAFPVNAACSFTLLKFRLIAEMDRFPFVNYLLSFKRNINKFEVDF